MDILKYKAILSNSGVSQILVPRRRYIDFVTNELVACSYGVMVNEACISIDTAKQLDLQDASYLSLMDELDSISVAYDKKCNKIYVLGKSISYTDDYDEEIVREKDRISLYGYSFSIYDGVQVDDELSFDRTLTSYEGHTAVFHDDIDAD